MATEHLTTVETVEELPEPIEGVRALITGERAVYKTKTVKGALKWVLETKLAAA